MSIYTKPPSHINTADLQELLQEKAVENIRLEFKLTVPDKDETLKKLSSFANTFGGLVVVGAQANSKDGRIQDLPGVDPVNGYKQTIMQWSFGAVSPPLIAEVSDPVPVPAGGRKVCYVISIAESDLAPHYLNGRKGAWIRTDEFSSHFDAQLADDNEIRHLLNRRQLVLDRRIRLVERARNRFDAYLSKKFADRGGQRTHVGPILEMCFVPRFPSRQICQQETLKDRLIKSAIPWRQTIFPDFARREILWQHESAIVLDAAVRPSFLEVNEWGVIFYGTTLDTSYEETRAIHPLDLVGVVLTFIRHASGLLSATGCLGPIIIETALRSVEAAAWYQIISGVNFMLADPKMQLDDDVVFSVATTSEALQQKPDDIATEVLRRTFFGLNRAGFVDTPENIANLIRHGYRMNVWDVPTTLRT